jgi:hypothetical protein
MTTTLSLGASERFSFHSPWSIPCPDDSEGNESRSSSPTPTHPAHATTPAPSSPSSSSPPPPSSSPPPRSLASPSRSPSPMLAPSAPKRSHAQRIIDSPVSSPSASPEKKRAKHSGTESNTSTAKGTLFNWFKKCTPEEYASQLKREDEQHAIERGTVLHREHVAKMERKELEREDARLRQRKSRMLGERD